MKMSKEEFVRATVGLQRHRKNEWLKKQFSASSNADCVLVEHARKTMKKNNRWHA